MTEEFKVTIGEEPINVSFTSGFPIGSVSSFTDLEDTPEDYVGDGSLLPRVKSTEDGLEFFQIGLGDISPNDHHLLNGLEDDDHDLYLRHDGDRLITGVLKPESNNTYDLGEEGTRQFKTVHAKGLKSSIDGVGGTARLDIGADHSSSVVNIYAANDGYIYLGAGKDIQLETATIRLIGHDKVELQSNLEPDTALSRNIGAEGSEILGVYANALVGPNDETLGIYGRGDFGKIEISASKGVYIYGGLDLGGGSLLDVGRIYGPSLDVDWSDGKNTPRIYSGDTEPSIPTDSWAYWYQDSTDQYWLVLNRGGDQRRVELK